MEATPAVVCGAYQQLGLTMSPQLARTVAAQAKRSFRGEHVYSGAGRLGTPYGHYEASRLTIREKPTL